MLHPSYSDLVKAINNETEGDSPMNNSRYSVVLATAKRARQLIGGEEAYVDSKGKKSLSVAVEEFNKGYVTIEPESKTEGAEAVFSDTEEMVQPEEKNIDMEG